MVMFDMPLEQLRAYTPERHEPADFDSFWLETLDTARQHPLDATFTGIAAHLETVETYDVSFRGYGGQPIKGWLLLPRQRSEPLPCVVEFVGYGGGRGFPHDWLLWPSAGFAHLVMDTRGQGSAWAHGDTPDPDPDGAHGQYPGFLTRGVLAPETYYYRRLYTDAVRAVEAAATHSAIASDRIAVTGRSQGGGLAIAVAALDPRVQVVIPDVPFLCHFRRAVDITDAMPYQELARFCATRRDQVDALFATLGYFDGVNFAARARCPALFSVALQDEVCPPSTVFAAFNHYQGPKEIRVWPFNHHEGGGSFQDLEKLRYLTGHWQRRDRRDDQPPGSESSSSTK